MLSIRQRLFSMAFISVSGEVGCPYEEVAELIARDLSAELLAGANLQHRIAEEFGAASIPEKARKYVTRSIACRIGTSKHVVISGPKSESVIRDLPSSLRMHVFRDRGGKVRDFDIVLNANSLDCPQMAQIAHSTICTMGLLTSGYLSEKDEAQAQFDLRLQMARFGIAPQHGTAAARKQFNHPSEEIFANLLDFYGIRWEYEPRSFPLQWDKDGNVLEAFSPDFYLPEADLYVEITTMKQSLVTRKNRKVRLLRAIYPHVNIQVFYQKDFQDLVSKYGLSERVAG
ncbi:MAG TPA: hypothetical protein VKU01_16670 [Bryobacteraceae bacterium]|nr:hypothetical protein [Bryobacteraceae bacterium]